VLANSGHIQSLINPPGNAKAYFWAGASSAPDARAWRENAAKQAGSWWPHWREWIMARSVRTKSVPGELGNKANPPLEAAPGRYVLET
jgi:polyhydroxyalkanoate synthase